MRCGYCQQVMIVLLRFAHPWNHADHFPEQGIYPLLFSCKQGMINFSFLFIQPHYFLCAFITAVDAAGFFLVACPDVVHSFDHLLCRRRSLLFYCPRRTHRGEGGIAGFAAVNTGEPPLPVTIGIQRQEFSVSQAGVLNRRRF